jgi:uncharacterized protein
MDGLDKLASPFIYGKTVSKVAFTNREDELQKLKNNLQQGINSMLISPRRWGKSSLVEQVIYLLEKENSNFKIVSIDLFSVPSQKVFLEVFAREVIKASSGKWQDWVNMAKQVFKNLSPKITVGINPKIDFTITFDYKELEKFPDEILNLPQVLSDHKDVRYIICLDEFQNLATLDGYEVFEKKMRAVWQRQSKVTYCLYGSRRHMMTDIFNSPSKPFYRFGDIILLDKIKEDKWVKFITSSFKRTGKRINENYARSIAQKMQNHPWYVQQLAHYTWQNTQESVSMSELNSALSELVRANSPLYQRELELLTNQQINLLKAISNEEKQLTSKDILREYKLGTSASVVKNKRMMLSNDIIDEQAGKLSFLDPAFELWFRKLFFQEDFLIQS